MLASVDVHRKYWLIWTHLPPNLRKQSIRNSSFFTGLKENLDLDILFVEMRLSKTFDNHRKLLTVHQLLFEGKKVITATTSWNCLDFLKQFEL